MNNMKRNACQKCVFAVDDDKPHCGLRGFRSDFNVESCSAENDTLPNGYELQEDGYFSWVKKKKEYPKTYEECCEVIFGKKSPYSAPQVVKNIGYKGDLFTNLQRLIFYRDAYWKIAGEEMGLGKPWEPDWEDDTTKYTLVYINNGIEKDWELHINHTLSFPTEEMRDAFKENFDKDLEICKELL